MVKYYPNNWQAIKDAPSEYFEECSYEDFYLWKLNGWEIPSSVMCIFRVENTKTGKVKEHVYKNAKSAHKKLLEYMKTGDHAVTVVNHDSIHLICNENDDESSND